ncbi:D-alanyl-D-alanine carboxypeptidase family protein [Candidatus Parabeggiatoa sp. HSG14]|uniref:D-alanyl-D-alanine carboxypeptidase family protein n=1 Tax=Candidatus Parabeggiatoa sp. HSG14 TaxID=3055593 RepID=UPI0025A87AB4|nr:D-alanyl-D-alanine carboxypeptidase family protein [Thiotrichales bacterium HSG14]
MKMLNLLLFALTSLYSIQAFANLTLMPQAPPITAHSYFLQDFHSGKIIMEKNADERLESASLTKLMTAYLVFQKIRIGKIKLNDTVKISEKAWRTLGSRMYVEVDTKVSVELLLKGMIIQSGNDASVALAEFVGGTEKAFVSLMNEEVQRLGLANTRYVNSTGLPDEQQHYSTARDIARIATNIISEFPEYYRWYSEREFTYNNIPQHNRNILLGRDPSVDGMKTGHTDAAGYCLVASAKRGEMRLISVLMNAKNKQLRSRESEKILDYGFRFFDTYQMYQPYQPIDTTGVWQGNTNQLQLGLEKPLYITIPSDQYRQLKVTLFIDKHIRAPIIEKKIYGTLKITLNNERISERPLIALTSVEKGNLWKRLVDSLLLFFIEKL